MKRYRTSILAFAVLAGALFLATTGTPAAATEYCHDFGTYSCPTGAQSWCVSEPIDASSQGQAQVACAACLGGACDVAEYTYLPGCGVVYSGLTNFNYGPYGCPQPGGQLSFNSTYVGIWSELPKCSNGVFDAGTETDVDCGGECPTPCCVPDGVISRTEDCDDGNSTPGDGCTACEVDGSCWNCSGEPTVCTPLGANSSCPDDGNACTGDVCDGSGSCLHPDFDGQPCPSDGNACTSDTCVIDTCTHSNEPNGTACTDDANSCTSDACSDGVCLHDNVPAGSPCPSDGNACTVDHCDSSGACVNDPATGVACSDDFNECTSDVCDAGGSCSHSPMPGAPCSSDGEECTSDVCDAVGTCVHLATVYASCSSDGDPCTVDSCSAGGICEHGPNTGAACADDGNPCTDDVCDVNGVCSHPPGADGTPCDDSSACTSEDACAAGACVGGDSVVCCDGGTCDPGTGACSSCPAGYRAYSTFACIKDYLVTAADLDGVESTCSPDEPLSANGMGFHVDEPHDPGVGAVYNWDIRLFTGASFAGSGTSIPVTLNGHTIGSYFDGPGGCGGAATTRNLGNSFTSYFVRGTRNSLFASWSGANHAFRADEHGVFAVVSVMYAVSPGTPLPDGTACDDGNACTTTDACQSGSCSGSAVTCAASDSCHEAGTCNPSTGQCSNPVAADWTNCDDGNACTQTDLCYGGTCTGLNEVYCYSLNQCDAPGTCNPATGLCSDPTPRPNGATCSDGNNCTQDDTCQAGFCVSGAAVTCGPAPGPCFNDGYCDYASGSCVYAPKGEGAPCNDGTACTTGDTCHSGTCTGSTLPNGSACDDGNLCTTDDSCQAGLCQPGAPFTCKPSSDACHVAEACDPVNGCLLSSIDCDDGSVCTTDSCDNNTGCVHEPIACEASDACHIAGTCDPATGCSETARSCDDGSACTTDTCDPTSGCFFEPDIRHDCRAATGSKLSYSDSDDDATDKLSWKWGPGASTSPAEFGTPAAGTDYQVCLFSVRSDASSLLLDATVPAGASFWAAAGSSGFKYSDKYGSADGVTKMLLKGSLADKSKIGVSGRGAWLSDPPLPLDAGLEGVTVQLTNLENGICWESTFPAASIVETEGKFGAKVP